MLGTRQVRAVYDRLGPVQDRQAFYEDPALERLLAHAAFERAGRVFEFGCGTGRFAARLLEERLPPGAGYEGIDLSPRMVALARARLARFAARARVELAEGPPSLALATGSVDRLVSTYVLDLLSEAAIRELLAEAHRVLTPEGMLCLVSLTEGTTARSRALMALWRTLFRLRPQWVGGCRPIQLVPFLEPSAWRIEHRSVVVAWGIPSEVVVARPVRPTPRDHPPPARVPCTGRAAPR